MSTTEKEVAVTSNKAGIPAAEFVEDVEAFMARAENDSVEGVLRRLNEQHQKYKFMELNLNTKKRRLKTQIPDIKGTLETVKHLKDNNTETIKTNFMLADNLYVKASVPPTDKVGLWLGANIMLEYSLDEADVLLSKNLSQAKQALDTVDEDLGFLRDQTTTTEVSIARVYNYDVKKRQAQKQSGVAVES